MLSAGLLLIAAADIHASAIVDVADPSAPQRMSPALPKGGDSGNGLLTIVDSALQRLADARTIAPQPDNVFGESVDPMGRNFRFFQTDILLRGIGPDIAISRSLDVNASRSTWWQREREFADWRLELPRMSTLTPNPGLQAPWSVAGAQAANRCTSFGLARDVKISGYDFPASEWWQGVQLTIPGSGSQEVLRRTSQNTLAPIMSLDGQALAFPLVTTAHWMISCLPSTSNGAAGEGFLAVSPRGDKYWFDRLVTGGWEHYQMPFQIGFAMSRFEATMLPSRIEDRFGNALTLTYEGARLTSVTATDGRALSLSWQSVNGIAFISSVTEQPGDPNARTWNYAYLTPGPGRTLSSVKLPDGSKWAFDFNQMTKYCGWWTDDPNGPACSDNPGALGTNTGIATSPSGVTGTFKVYGQLGYRYLTTPLPSPDCLHEADPGSAEFIQVYAWSRHYTGPGIDQLWSYDPCPGECPSLANMNLDEGSGLFVETDPSGVTTMQAVDHTWCGPHQGDVTKTYIAPVFDDQGFVSAARIIDTTKALPDVGPFPAHIGTVPQTYANRTQLEYLRPLQRRDIVQDGVTFTWKAETFDALGRPRTVKRSSTPGSGASRTETTTYNDNKTRWVLGQIAEIKEAGTASPMLARNFDTAGNMIDETRFAAVPHGFTYHPNGLVKTVTDGSGHVTSLSDYKRGIPQTVSHADGKTTTAVVDALGQITSRTNELGHTTSYLYDAMGRLRTTTFPADDTVAWNTVERTFEQVNAAEYGLGAGHWRLTESSGNARAITYYDARWRPVLTRSHDTADEADTSRMVLRRFDAANRETFVSYPQRSIASVQTQTPGIATSFDALGRPLEAIAASELGALTTSIAYLDGFTRRTTNARGAQTTENFLTFDEPDTRWPLSVLEPHGVTTTFSRDVFGKPRSMKRTGSWDNGLLISTRRYVYDAQQRLCKTIEPETGATILGYDAAGNIAWHAAGQSQPSEADCDRNTVAAAQRTVNNYDGRNRLIGVNHPTDTADLAFTYFADGALRTASTAATTNAPASTWTYAYNKRGLPTNETLAFDGKQYVIGHGYDANGARSNLAYPGGLSVAFAPDALGEPTRAGSYAIGAVHHPNGAVATWTYGNGATREQLLNLRQLPERLRDRHNGVALLDHGFDYDENGNLVARTDAVGQGFESGDFTYDDRDRLRTATVPDKFGVESFEYDPLDNVRRAVIGSLDLRYDIDSSNRLQRIRLGSDTLHAYTWNSRGALASRSRPGEPNPDGVFRDGFETGGDVLPSTEQTFVFDSANRLARIHGLERYAYDAHGHRLRTRRDDGSVRDEIRDIGGRLLYAEDTRDNRRTDYIALGSTLVAKRSRPLVGNTAATTYLHSDARGTPSVESDAAGQTVLRSRLTAYGAPYDGLWRDGPGFTGHTSDAASQLVYMQQRYYDPLMLRFLSPDPIAATPGSYNRYWYANNNPYRFVDPDGRESGAFYTQDRYRMPMPRTTSGQAWAGLAAQAAVLLGPIAMEAGMAALANPAAANSVAVGLLEAGMGNALGGGSLVGGAAILSARVETVHSALDPIAAARRTTAALDTVEGQRIFASGGRDLSPMQRALMGPSEVAAKSPGSHAEATAIQHATQNGLTPIEISVSRAICPECKATIEQSGGQLTSPTTAFWPEN